MGIRLGTVHISTLAKLHQIAEKHNCYIAMGVDDVHDNEECDMNSIAKRTDMSDEIKRELEYSLDKTGEGQSGYRYWFELIDKRSSQTKHNYIEYQDIDTWFSYDPKDIDELSEETQEWLEENDEYENGVIWQRCDSQSISGWEGVDTSEINVYREGMLLKFFGDLVCDYLGEERIVEVY